jgi:hypothetical protein
VAYIEGNAKFLTSYTEAYHYGLYTLHNFIRDSKLYDHKFDKCDKDEDDLPGAACAALQTQWDDEPEVENE